MNDRELAWDYFKKTFLAIVDEHTPIRRYRVRGRDTPWFNDSMAIRAIYIYIIIIITAIRERNEASVKAKRNNDIFIDKNIG